MTIFSGEGAYLRGGAYFEFHIQQGRLIKGGRLIEGGRLFEEIRYLVLGGLVVFKYVGQSQI